MSILRNSRLAPASFMVLACVLGASNAWADRKCEEDPAITGRTCSMVDCLSLQSNVNSACKNPEPVSCRRLSGCNVLRQERDRWLQCYIARTIINSRCWNNGDPGHQRAAAQAIQNVSACDAKIAEPKPVGCADPCP
ncbi:hypothetical protein [Archangium sp.]|uniref:hypothetical protein n=1 Tax=Archangium sp. TaxID=1872627 RepID=UPI002D65CC59|nr:hypothetical protein [Archangium sp.]HYO52213.1 hypothetical protein [Archangium sp.]